MTPDRPPWVRDLDGPDPERGPAIEVPYACLTRMLRTVAVLGEGMLGITCRGVLALQGPDIICSDSGHTAKLRTANMGGERPGRFGGRPVASSRSKQTALGRGPRNVSGFCIVRRGERHRTRATLPFSLHEAALDMRQRLGGPGAKAATDAGSAKRRGSHIGRSHARITATARAGFSVPGTRSSTRHRRNSSTT